jgi:hypothetical protein
MPETPERPHRTGAFWLDFMVAAGAVIISLISLWVAQRSDATQERLLAASVWPYVEFYSSNLLGHKREVQLSLHNAGVGPARIRWVAVDYQNRSVRDPRSLLHSCCEKNGERGLDETLITSTVTHTVLVPHEVVNFVIVDPTAANGAEYKLLNKARNHLRVRVCYCSVLDACWLLDSYSEEDPKPVNKCTPVPDNAYEA